MDMWKLIMTHSKDKYIASFSRLSIFDRPFGILLRLFIRHNSICGWIKNTVLVKETYLAQ